jgi:hypothetical protein
LIAIHTESDSETGLGYDTEAALDGTSSKYWIFKYKSRDLGNDNDQSLSWYNVSFI